MKVFKGNQKSWAIELWGLEDVAELVAVDIQSGQRITTIETFQSNGDVTIHKEVKGELESNGYDPYEHSNRFDQKGRLMMDHEV